MSFWKNKHLLVAALMAPVLGVGSYFAVNFIVGEKPHAAESGQSYVLVEKPNCRYSSGSCGLKNGDFELTFNFEQLENDRTLLILKSVVPLDGIKLALAAGDDGDEVPSDMLATGNDGLGWYLEVPRPDPENHRIRLAAVSNQVIYFGDVSTKFTLIEPQTDN